VFSLEEFVDVDDYSDGGGGACCGGGVGVVVFRYVVEEVVNCKVE